MASHYRIFATKSLFRQTRLELKAVWQIRERFLEPNQGTEYLGADAGLREDEFVVPYQVNDREIFPPYV